MKCQHGRLIIIKDEIRLEPEKQNRMNIYFVKSISSRFLLQYNEISNKNFKRGINND